MLFYIHFNTKNLPKVGDLPDERHVRETYPLTENSTEQELLDERNREHLREIYQKVEENYRLQRYLF